MNTKWWWKCATGFLQHFESNIRVPDNVNYFIFGVISCKIHNLFNIAKALNKSCSCSFVNELVLPILFTVSCTVGSQILSTPSTYSFFLFFTLLNFCNFHTKIQFFNKPPIPSLLQSQEIFLQLQLVSPT